MSALTQSEAIVRLRAALERADRALAIAEREGLPVAITDRARSEIASALIDTMNVKADPLVPGLKAGLDLATELHDEIEAEHNRLRGWFFGMYARRRHHELIAVSRALKLLGARFVERSRLRTA